MNRYYKNPINKILKEKYSFVESEIMYKCLYNKGKQKKEYLYEETLIFIRKNTEILNKFKMYFFIIFEYFKFKKLKKLKMKILNKSYANKNYIYSSIEELNQLVYCELEKLINKYCSIKSK